MTYLGWRLLDNFANHVQSGLAVHRQRLLCLRLTTTSEQTNDPIVFTSCPVTTACKRGGTPMPVPSRSSQNISLPEKVTLMKSQTAFVRCTARLYPVHPGLDAHNLVH